MWVPEVRANTMKDRRWCKTTMERCPWLESCRKMPDVEPISCRPFTLERCPIIRGSKNLPETSLYPNNTINHYL